MIYINETTRISKFDEMNLQIEVLKDVKSRTTGELKSEWQRIGYYGDLKTAFNGVLSKELFESVEECNSIKGLIEKISETEKNIIKAISNLDGE